MEKRIGDVLTARRDLLKLGGYGLLAAFADQALLPVQARAYGKAQPRGTARFCIVVELAGAISHTDTFDFKENEQKMYRHSAEVIGQIGRSMNPTIMGNPTPRLTWNVVPYQSTHNTGGAIMGTDPGASALNKYLQSWDVANVFVMGASSFPHNSGYNPRARLAHSPTWRRTPSVRNT